MNLDYTINQEACCNTWNASNMLRKDNCKPRRETNGIFGFGAHYIRDFKVCHVMLSDARLIPHFPWFYFAKACIIQPWRQPKYLSSSRLCIEYWFALTLHKAALHRLFTGNKMITSLRFHAIFYSLSIAQIYVFLKAVKNTRATNCIVKTMISASLKRRKYTSVQVCLIKSHMWAWPVGFGYMFILW